MPEAMLARVNVAVLVEEAVGSPWKEYMRMSCIPRKFLLACALSPLIRVPPLARGMLRANWVFTAFVSPGFVVESLPRSSDEHDDITPSPARATVPMRKKLLSFFIKMNVFVNVDALVFKPRTLRFQAFLVVFCKRSRFAVQKLSFCSPKGLVLRSKRSPLAPQKESF